ncbi:hypothetical protein NE237_011165 [Protea cynaroides]|uniref:Polygalacturonase n=1 Tax=Protea cynaroides TaxID=273540 RepID=A0A9Q0GUG0_9MAGN|nr:hypothetical protein NE237_011165 [Protea cynaroides]
MATVIMVNSSLLPLLIFFIVLLQLFSSTSAVNSITIENFGAIGDGITDAGPAMLAAWSAACTSLVPVDILVPRKTYFLTSVVLNGPCNNSLITFQMEGSTLLAPDYKDMKLSSDYWIRFNGVQGVSLIGGFLDGKGSDFWKCKASTNTASCLPNTGASSLGFLNSKDILVQKLTSSDSKLFHLVFLSSRNVTLDHVTIKAPGDSPNTGGIHVQGSTQVLIQDTGIMTGDDCISVGPGTQDLQIMRVNCGPRHGISIGSLGKGTIEAGVEGVLVRNSTFSGSTNGDSGVKVSNVTYSNIVGTSATPIAMNFNCSTTVPCEEIILEAINLNLINGQPTSFCHSAKGTVRAGVISPTINFNTCT